MDDLAEFYKFLAAAGLPLDLKCQDICISFFREFSCLKKAVSSWVSPDYSYLLHNNKGWISFRWYNKGKQLLVTFKTENEAITQEIKIRHQDRDELLSGSFFICWTSFWVE